MTSLDVDRNGCHGPRRPAAGPDHVTRQARWIAAPPEVVWDALHAVRLSGLPLTVVLGAVRFLPVVLTGGGRDHLHDRPFLDALPVPLLSSEPPESVVFGGALQAWRLTGGEQPPVLDADGLRAWSEPGWVKPGWTSGSHRAATAPS